MLAMLNTDGTTIKNVVADPTAHTLDILDGTTGTDHGPTVSRHDNNHVPVGVAVSNADGKTPVVLYADSTGALLVQST